MIRFTLRLGLIAAAALLVPACGSGSRGISGLGTLMVLSRGGTATNGIGGKGGNFRINAVTGSDLLVLAGGSMDASFVLPPTNVSLGAHPRHVTADTVYTVGAGVHTQTALTYGDTGLVADDGIFPATGLWIDPGVTLTFPPNDSNPSSVQLILTFSDGVLIQGTLQMGRKVTVPSDGAILNLSAMSLVSAPGSRIDTAGSPGGAGSGGNGGQVILTGTTGMVHQGTISTQGGDGALSGGNGGPCNLGNQTGTVYSTGSILTGGGSGAAGTGGMGGSILVAGSTAPSTTGGVNISGTLQSRGGSGSSQGGTGGVITVTAAFTGGVLSSAAIDSSGGDATASGAGGAAGSLLLAGTGYPVIVAGSVTGRGGKGIGGINSGGPGAALALSTQNSPGILAIGLDQASGGISMSAALDTRGGDGPVGGAGGSILITANSDTVVNAAEPGRDPIVLAGYLGFDFSGGDGTSAGGAAGSGVLSNQAAADKGGGLHIGSIRNEANWTGRGGNASAGAGGSGGLWVVRTDVSTKNVAPSYTRSAVNFGAIDCSGGNGTTSGGTTDNGFSNTISLYDHVRCSNFGPLTANGGNGGTGPGGTPGNSTIQILSEGAVENSAPLTTNGGASSSGAGGNSGMVALQAGTVVHTGSISAIGGDSVSGAGGNGLQINIAGIQSASSVHGTLSVRGGAGAAAGTAGTVFIDGIEVVLSAGSVSY